jgi:hypothetical protein
MKKDDKKMMGKKMPAFMEKKPMKKMADGGKVMKYADGGMACGHKGAQDYGKK